MADASKPPGRREAFGAYYFTVQIDLIEDSHFKSCSGLKSEAEVQEIAEGGVNTHTHKLIGRTKFPNLVLKRGFSGPLLWNLRMRYLEDSKDGEITRFSGVIVQKGPNGAEGKWHFEDGWICKWEGPDFDASKNEISVETIEIAHEGLTKFE